MNRTKRKSRGFTLIELLVVIAIIALLMAIIMPALRAAKDQARLAVCANNMRQLAIAVNTYMADNDSKTPPCIVRFPSTPDSYSWPNFLNHFGRGTYQYLGKYVPDVGAYMCPMAPANPVDYQESYVHYEGTDVMVSYNMYWGGFQMEDIRFTGPIEGNSRTRLLASDTLNYGPTNDGLSHWYSSHRYKECYKTNINDNWGNLISTLWFIDNEMTACPKGMKMNATYTDGHVQRYTSDETIHHQHGPERRFQVPPQSLWK